MSDGIEGSIHFVPLAGPKDEGAIADAIAQTNTGADQPATSAGGIPALLDTACQRRYRQEFLREFEPVGPTENALVTELARQAAALDRWGEAALAVERQAARGLKEFAGTAGIDEVAFDDALLAASVSTEVADRCERHSLARSRGFHRVLQKLEEVQTRRKQREKDSDSRQLPISFPDEAACEQYLADRFRARKYQCPACGCHDGYLIAGRRSWECGSCHLQVGLRSGTVMARSRISLWRWMEAIRWIVSRPTIRTAELAEKVGITRTATVRAMAQRIREAMGALDAGEQLAGLDQHFLRMRT